MELTATFWCGRRVLLTGHTGFKGGWLALWLLKLGAQVRGFALPAPDGPSLWQVVRLEQELAGGIGDIRDAQALAAAMNEFRPQLILHLAAQPLVRRSYALPADTYATNVLGTVNLLEAARHCDTVQAIVVVTSDKCYENREWLWPYRETDALGGHDPYSNSKACAELVCAAYRASFFAAASTGVATARAGNVIGGGDWSPDRLLPDLFRAWESGTSLTLRYPDAQRPWQHVLEPLAGYLQLAAKLLTERENFDGAWNFGPAEHAHASVAQVVDEVARLWPQAPGWRVEAEPQPHEARLLALDSTRARTQLHWRPLWGLEQALEATVKWQQAWRSGADMREVTMRQIDDYQERVNE